MLGGKYIIVRRPAALALGEGAIRGYPVSTRQIRGDYLLVDP